MDDYILSIIAVAACGSIVNAMCPDGEGKSIKKMVSFIMSLLLIVSVARPLILLVRSIESFNGSEYIEKFTESTTASYEDAWQNTLQGISTESVENYILGYIEEKFELDRSCFDISAKLSFNGAEIQIDNVEITLRGRGLLKNPRSIEMAVEEKMQCDCIIYEEWGEKNGDQ